MTRAQGGRAGRSRADSKAARGTLPSVARRPRDRRAQIAAAAAGLFSRRGYDGVTVAAIASEVGISAGAVYRHFPDKITLLSDPVREMVVSWYAAALIAVDGGTDPLDRIERLSGAVVEVALDRPDVVALWHRESRHLPASLRAELVDLRARTVQLWAHELGCYRGDLSEEESEFRVRAALGLLNCVPEITHQVARGRLAEHLRQLVLAVVLAPQPPVPPEDALPEGGTSPGASDRSRREALLRAGALLFRERGYHRVGIDDIGEAAGIRGPSVYGYFSSKEDVLFELLSQMADRLDAEINAVTSHAEGEAALRELLRRYIGLTLANRDLVATYASELKTLPAARLRLLTQRRHDRSRRWTALLCACRPDLSERLAKVSVLATLEMLFAVARSRRFEDLPALPARLENLAWSALAVKETS